MMTTEELAAAAPHIPWKFEDLAGGFGGMTYTLDGGIRVVVGGWSFPDRASLPDETCHAVWLEDLEGELDMPEPESVTSPDEVRMAILQLLANALVAELHPPHS